MNAPDVKTVHEHDSRHGGLWRIVPAPQGGKQPRPIFARLTVSVGISTPSFVWYEGGSLDATINENPALQNAEWIPVDTKGERLDELRRLN